MHFLILCFFSSLPYFYFYIIFCFILGLYDIFLVFHWFTICYYSFDFSNASWLVCNTCCSNVDLGFCLVAYLVIHSSNGVLIL